MHRQDRGWRDFIVNTEYVRKEEEEEEEEKEEERRKEEEGAGGVQEKQEPHTKDVGKNKNPTQRMWGILIVKTHYMRKEEEAEEEEERERRGAGGAQEKQEPHTKDVGKNTTNRFRRHFPKSTATPLWGARMCENTCDMQQECIEKTEVGEISL